MSGCSINSQAGAGRLLQAQWRKQTILLSVLEPFSVVHNLPEKHETYACACRMFSRLALPMPLTWPSPATSGIHPCNQQACEAAISSSCSMLQSEREDTAMSMKLCPHQLPICASLDTNMCCCFHLKLEYFLPAHVRQCDVAVICRYQLIAGVIEQRGIERIFENNPRITNALSFVARTGNTFLGSWWVAASSFCWLVDCCLALAKLQACFNKQLVFSPDPSAHVTSRCVCPVCGRRVSAH